MKILYPPFKNSTYTLHTSHSILSLGSQLAQYAACRLHPYPPPRRISRNWEEYPAISRNCTEVLGMVSCGCCGVQV